MGNISSATACLGCGHGNTSSSWKPPECDIERTALENCRKCKIKSSSKTSTRAYSESKSWYRSHRVTLESQRVNIENLIEKAASERTTAMVSESFMLQNLSVIENQKAKLDILFRKSNEYSSSRGQYDLTDLETTTYNCSLHPPVKTVSFCGIVDELLFDREDSWHSDEYDEEEYESGDEDSLGTASDSPVADEDEEDIPHGDDPRLYHMPRWSPDFIGAARAPSLTLSPSLSPVARLMDAAAAKIPGPSPRTIPFRCADAR